MIYLMIAFALGSASYAAETGHFEDSNGSTIDVDVYNKKGDETHSHSIGIHTQGGQSTCDFTGLFEERDEGELYYSEDGCNVHVSTDGYQHTAHVRASGRGCEQWGGVGCTLSVAKARLKH